jgi:tetratricopeptide (TPR) repeat protein
MKRALLPALVWGALSLPLSAAAHEDELLPTGEPERLGAVSFPTSCNAAAQAQFDRALALLHSFFYPAAAQAFERAAQADASCAIAHWGVAMSQWYPLWYPPTRESFDKGKQALRGALGSGPKTAREQAYIDALSRFYTDFTVDHGQRARDYVVAMQALHERFPEDSEGALFFALALQATANPNDRSYANQLRSAALIERVFAAQPDHPGAAHYLIHAYDYPELALRALPAARRYGEIAPSMPHALHMPSHTYIAVGLWQDAIDSNLKAAEAARRLGWPQEELHAMDYLVYAYLQSGRGVAAERVAREIAGAPLDPKTRTLPLDYSRAASPARVVLEQRRWQDAVQLPVADSRFPATMALTRYARALGFVHLSDVAAAKTELQGLSAIRDALLAANQDYWAKQVEVQRQTVQAWIAWLRGERDAALAGMRSAAQLEESTYKHPVTPGQLLPARELLADMLLDLDQPAAALWEYEAVLQANPNRFNTLYGAAIAAEHAGMADQARTFYTRLTELCQASDSDRRELDSVRVWLAGH